MEKTLSIEIYALIAFTNYLFFIILFYYLFMNVDHEYFRPDSLSLRQIFLYNFTYKFIKSCSCILK